MDIRYSGKNIKVTQDLKEHMDERISRIDKYSPKIVESHVVISKEKLRYLAHVTLLGKSFKAFGEGDDKENVYVAIDQAIDKVQTQLKKHREKVKDHHKEHGENALPLKEKIADKIMNRNAEETSGPAIIRMPSYAPKPMSPEEASMQLNMGNQEFLVFNNATSGIANVIFKLDDGNHGLIEPDFK